jgi:hypothetical protein
MMSTQQTILDLFIKNDINPWFTNSYFLFFSHYFALVLVNCLAYSYIFLKLFKTLCYSKMTFDWLPMINPYIWPFSLFDLVTGWYFEFWEKIFPTLKFESATFDISAIMALEAINSIMYFCVKLANFLIVVLEETEQARNLLNITS